MAGQTPLASRPARWHGVGQLPAMPLTRLWSAARPADQPSWGMGMRQGEALAEGFYWYAEKLMGLREHYQEPAGSPAHLRPSRRPRLFGRLHPHRRASGHGKGTGQNPSEALRSYQTAARAGNYLAYVFIARLLSCTEHFPRAEPSANRNMTGLLRKGPDFDGRPHPFGNARTAFAEPPDESDDALTNDRYTARA